jgi:hypothetical protein
MKKSTRRPLQVKRAIDQSATASYHNLIESFAAVSRARANVWMTTAVVLFFAGFFVAIFYVSHGS